MIQVNNLSYAYPNHPVLKNLDFSVNKRDFVHIQGANGSGKSTLLQLILKEKSLQSGSIKLLGQDIQQMKDFTAIGYVPQMQVMNQIAFPVTALELVVLNLYQDFNLFNLPTADNKRKAAAILKRLKMKQYLHTPVNELSGGLKQRAMIARALINQPELLILDEPTTGIDPESREQLFDILLSLQQASGLTIVMVSHDLDITQERIPDLKKFELKGGQLEDVSL